MNIVITSIFYPTEAVRRFAKLAGCRLIVVGDEKTPRDWHCAKVDYFSIDRQATLPYQLVNVLPHNHYCRKMLGYLVAMHGGGG